MRGFIRESESKLPVSTLSRREKQKRGLVKRARFLVLFGPLPDCSNCFHKIIHILYVCGCCCDVSFMSVFFLKLKLWRHTCRSLLVRCFKHWLSHTHKFQPLRTFAAICACLTYRVGTPRLFQCVAVMFHVSRFPAADTFKTKLDLRVCCIKRCRQTFNARCRIPKLSNSNCLRILLPLMLVSTTG